MRSTVEIHESQKWVLLFLLIGKGSITRFGTVERKVNGRWTQPSGLIKDLAFCGEFCSVPMRFAKAIHGRAQAQIEKDKNLLEHTRNEYNKEVLQSRIRVCSELVQLFRS